MNKLVSNIEKLKPFFEKVSRNRYLRAIRDGFISAMPIVLFSSILCYLHMYQISLVFTGLKK